MQLVWTTGHLTISSINPEESMYRAWKCSVCICFKAFDKDSFQMPVTDSQSWTASWLYEMSVFIILPTKTALWYDSCHSPFV